MQFSVQADAPANAELHNVTLITLVRMISVL
jgi:hypothetical protein